MSGPLRIFISHKMPSDTILANDIGSKLALFSGERVKVSHAGKFRIGEQWRPRIEQELDAADWLIYLHTDPDEDWQFCMYECGYFLGRPKTGRDRLLVTFCRKQEQITPALKEFNALVISEQEVIKLIKQIYRDDPWKIKPDLSEEEIVNTARYIVAKFQDTDIIIRNLDVAPGIIFEINLDNDAKTQLRSFKLPVGTSISGIKDWQKLFGRETDTGAWPWHELAAHWEYGSVYEFLFAKMFQDAIDNGASRGVLLRSIASQELYRVTLRRYEVFSGGIKYKFHLTAAELNLPFDLSSDLLERKEVVLYHLVNLTWYFRRRLVDNLYNQLLALSEIRNADKARYETLYNDIRHELMDIQAQSIIRKADSPRVVRDALGKDDPVIVELMNRVVKWYDLQPELFTLMDQGPSSIHAVARKMYELTEINRELYQAAARAYYELAKTLEAPSRL